MGVHRNLAGFSRRWRVPSLVCFRIASFRCTDYLRRRRQHDEYDDERTFAEDRHGPRRISLYHLLPTNKSALH